MTAPRLAVVIPTLNEAEALPALLADLQAQQDVHLDIVVADGGSVDATAQLGQAGGARIVRASRGRARQLNAGAAASSAETLLFLHADSRLLDPRLLANAWSALSAARARGGCVAGHFALRFGDGSARYAALYGWMASKTRSNRPYSINGDQGLLIARGDFLALGCYDETLGVLEDQDLARRIHQQGHWVSLPGELITSARRFESEGAAERYTLMAVMMGLWAAGCREFFQQAPQIYSAQADTHRLDLRPFVTLVGRILRDQGWGAWGTLYRVGAFSRENAWQLFHYLDWRGHGDGRWLRRYDRWIAPLIAHPPGNALAALLTAIWFFVWLPLQLRRA